MPPARSTKTAQKPTKTRDCLWVLSNILSRMSPRIKSDKHTISPNIGSPRFPSLRPLPLHSDPVGQPRGVQPPPSTRQTVSTYSTIPGPSLRESSLRSTKPGLVFATDSSSGASQATSVFPASLRSNQHGHASITDSSRQTPQAISSSSRLYPRHSRQSTAHPYSRPLRYAYAAHPRDSRPLAQIIAQAEAQIIALEEALTKLREESNKELAHLASCMADLLVQQQAYCKRLKIENAGRLKAQQHCADVKELVQEKIQLVAARDKTIAERDAVIRAKDTTIAVKDQELVEKDETIRRLNGKIEIYQLQLQQIEDEKLKLPLANTSYDALCEARDAFEAEKKRAVEAFHKERGEFEVEKNKIAEQHERFVKENELLQKEATQTKKALEDLPIEAQRIHEERERMRKELAVRAAQTLAAEPEDAEMRSASLESLGSTAAPNRYTSAFAAPTFPLQTPTFTPETPANPGFKFTVARAVPTWTPDPTLAEERAARPVKALPRRRMRP